MTGDLAFRLGRTLQSAAIAGSTNGQQSEQKVGYSHAGVVIRTDSAVMVLHIEPQPHAEERLKIESIEEFFSAERSQRGAIVRHQRMDIEEQEMAIEIAKSLLDKGICFDHDYSLSDSEKMYCTELTEYIFQKVGITLSTQRHRLPLAKEPVILPNDILSNEELRRVWHYPTYD